MITSEEWLSPTRASGLLAYGSAVVCCAIVWLRARKPASRLARVLMVIECVLLLDIAFNWRWMLHGVIAEIAASHHEYEQRRLPQFIALVILAGLLLVGLFAVLRIFRNRTGALLAVAGILISVISWCVEVVSLHAVDHILYHPLGPCMVISVVWILGCLMTCIGVLVDLRQVTGVA
jgi:hypothetical protein